MIGSDQAPDENTFIRRMRMGRVRQQTIALTSVLTAVIGVFVLSPVLVGAFAYYTITVLLVLNAVFALRQCRKVISPIERMLRHMQGIETAVNANKFNVSRLYNAVDDEFACLAAGMDSLIEKLTEKARASNERALRYVALVNAIPAGLVVVSNKGKVIRLVKQPDGTEPFQGLQKGARPDVAIWGQDNLEAFDQALDRAMVEDKLIWRQFTIHSPDLGVRHFRATLCRLNDFSALLSMYDVTALEQRYLEEGRPTNTTRAQKHAALRRMAASVAHDGRNVFAVLGNLVEIIRLADDPALRAQTETVADAVRRGTNLMTELMLYAGETPYHLQCMSAREACLKLYRNPTLKALLPDNIRLMTEVSEEPMPDIDVDVGQAWKVSFNLVKNAVEAIGSAPGRIWLSARPFEMTKEVAAGFRSTGRIPLGHGVMTVMADDGPGIPPALLDRLFDPYSSSKGEGRGLGLATVFSIVEAHNGAIRVTSQPGRGSNFEIFLPASRQSQSELEMVRRIAPNGEILLVDDDEAIQHTTRLVLKAIKIAAHPAGNADDALRKLRTLRERIRTVIVDAHLPQARQLLQTMRTDYPGAQIVLSSGTPEESLRALIPASLYDRFLAKPYTILDISKALGATAPDLS